VERKGGGSLTAWPTNTTRRRRGERLRARGSIDQALALRLRNIAEPGDGSVYRVATRSLRVFCRLICVLAT
jgi:hypothetical protein